MKQRTKQTKETKETKETMEKKDATKEDQGRRRREAGIGVKRNAPPQRKCSTSTECWSTPSRGCANCCLDCRRKVLEVCFELDAAVHFDLPQERMPDIKPFHIKAELRNEDPVSFSLFGALWRGKKLLGALIRNPAFFFAIISAQNPLFFGSIPRPVEAEDEQSGRECTKTNDFSACLRENCSCGGFCSTPLTKQQPTATHNKPSPCSALSPTVSKP